MEFRIETDTMGEVKVPAHVYWGPQTERSRNNFKIGPEASMPKEIIYAFGYLKKARDQDRHRQCEAPRQHHQPSMPRQQTGYFVDGRTA